MALQESKKQREPRAPWSRWLTISGFVLIVAVASAVIEVSAAVGCAFADGLSVQSSAPQDGAQDVPTKGEFWVEFDHNVAAVADNADCVSLQTAAGKEVASSKWSVELPDEQLEFGLRKHVIVKVKGLDAGKEYRICVDGALASKNGATLGADAVISFTTAAKGSKATALSEPQETAAGSGDGNGSGGGAGASSDGGDGEAAGDSGAADSSSASGNNSVDAVIGSDDGAGAQSNDGGQGEEESPSAVPVVLFVAVLAVLAVGWVIRWRKANANAPKRK